MKKNILVLSDTHSFLDNRFLYHAKQVDEIWHAGDIGSYDIIETLSKITTLRAVYGNIDNHEIRTQTKEILVFTSNSLTVLMTHIGGYPKKYSAEFKKEIELHNPDIIICGHSHILKVMKDTEHNALYINPGAAGNSGFHAVKTAVLFEISQGVPQNLRVIEISRK